MHNKPSEHDLFWKNKARGIDYDLNACLEYNPQAFSLDDIAMVLAVHQGVNDKDSWRWILQLSDGRYVFLLGGCDYTGWDCQSWAESHFAPTPEKALEFELTLPHDHVSMSTKEYKEMEQQLVTSKQKTQREIVGENLLTPSNTCTCPACTTPTTPTHEE